MTHETLTVTSADGVEVITLNRPAVMNALNAAMRAEIAAVVSATTARVVVLTGAGRGFCSGQDLGDADPATLDIEGTLNREYVPMLRAIRDCPVPVIAAVNGHAAGAGANLALMCDVVIASEAASFTQAFLRIGLIPDAGGTWTLPRQVGSARAFGAALFAEPVPARQAADWGMIWEAVPAERFDAHWRARAAQVAAAPAGAVRALKRAFGASPVNDLEAQLRLEAELQGQCGADPDFAEGVAAFREKRPARFNRG